MKSCAVVHFNFVFFNINYFFDPSDYGDDGGFAAAVSFTFMALAAVIPAITGGKRLFFSFSSLIIYNPFTEKGQIFL